MDSIRQGIKMVKVLNTYGCDEFICRVASTSYGKTYNKREPHQVDTMIKRLLRKEHMSPFEHACITYFIKCPIYVARHLVRHRTAKIVEKSLRYTKPEVATAEYLEAVSKQRFEEARRVLPLNTPTELVYTHDVRNLMHFFKLRLAEDAEDSTREVAQKMFAYFKDLFPITAKYFEEFCL